MSTQRELLPRVQKQVKDASDPSIFKPCKLPQRSAYQQDVENHLTGSYPPGWKGWQRRSLRSPIQPPRRAPYRSTASSVYSEQVGTKRHAGGSKGEMNAL